MNEMEELADYLDLVMNNSFTDVSTLFSFICI